jgi:hypothetical protein
MKNFKYMSLMMALMCVLSMSFISCGDDDDVVPAPVIALGEANIEGDEICVKAEVSAQGRVASITIEVTDAAGNSKVIMPVVDSKYTNVLNIAGFHKHVDIAGKGVVAGDILKFTVTDTNGRTTTVQKSITEEDDED